MSCFGGQNKDYRFPFYFRLIGTNNNDDDGSIDVKGKREIEEETPPLPLDVLRLIVHHLVKGLPETYKELVALGEASGLIREDDVASCVAQLQESLPCSANILTLKLTPRQRHMFTNKSVFHASYNMSGTLIVIIRFPSYIAELWDAITGELVHKLRGHSSSIHDASFSSGGTLVVTGSYDSTVRVWSIKNGSCVLTIKAAHHLFIAVSFSHDDKRIMTLSINLFDGGSSSRPFNVLETPSRIAKVWDASTGQLLKHVNTLVYPCTQPITSGTAMSAEQATWTTGHPPFFISTKYSSNLSLIATLSSDGTCFVWDAATGEHKQTLRALGESTNWWRDNIRSFDRPQFSDFRSVSFSPDDNLIVIASFDSPTVRIWRLDTGECVQILQTGHERGVASAKFSPDGKHVVTASFDGTVRLWNVADGRHLYLLYVHIVAGTPYRAMFTTVNFNSSGTRIVLGGLGEAYVISAPMLRFK